jgi:hypothetical protein
MHADRREVICESIKSYLRQLILALDSIRAN